ncbi:MAG TPA: cytochrome c-type biogenesis protein [Casimicrobiaceae bacterium]|nr:cytochrome c-type biogenesis protein [Casimicrobiaceae bacterium]
MTAGLAHALCAAALAAASSLATAATLAALPPDEALDARLRKLETQLRCLVCQNQTLADSNADLAADLRKEVRELAVSGKSDEEIRAYLVARYGDFVLYDPPLKAVTSLLWLGPFALLAGGGAIWWVVLRRRARAPAASAESEPEAVARARALLDGE